MTNDEFSTLFGGPPREPETFLTQREMDLAASIQAVTEDVVLKLSRKVKSDTGADAFCLAGGVALNCVANGRLLREGPFKHIWIQPAAGDAGGSLGCALAFWHLGLDQSRLPGASDGMHGSFLGPAFSTEEIQSFLKNNNIPYLHYRDENSLLETVAVDIAAEKVVGWFQGRMEFGPRALGARSIIGDARSSKMQSIMNLKIKHRESFRPFAPAILGERVSDYFDLDQGSPYMLLVAKVAKERRIPISNEDQQRWGIDLLNVRRSDIPAVTHVDYSARIQTVHEETNPRFYRLLRFFEKLTGCPVLVNTSFNVRGEPIVCTPDHAYRCFMRTEMDVLVLGDFVLRKHHQPRQEADLSWQKEFALD